MKTTLVVALGILILGGVAYGFVNPGILKSPQTESVATGTVPEQDDHVAASTDSSITWNVTAGEDAQGTPQTTVSVTVEGVTYALGTFMGSCNAIGANGGIDGTGLLAGELSAVQCWFAGSGDEIGVFAHEDGGYQIMVGELGEGEAGAGLFRGNFEIKHDIYP